MTKNEKKLASIMLELAADKFSNHTCNDFDLLEFFTPEEISDFRRKMHVMNNPKEPYSNCGQENLVMDWEIMHFLAVILENEIIDKHNPDLLFPFHDVEKKLNVSFKKHFPNSTLKTSHGYLDNIHVEMHIDPLDNSSFSKLLKSQKGELAQKGNLEGNLAWSIVDSSGLTDDEIKRISLLSFCSVD